MWSSFIKNDKNVNAIILIIGILIYPLGYWGNSILGNMLDQLRIDDILLFLFAWIASLSAVLISFIRIKNNFRSIIYWIGFVLNYIFLIAPGIILIWAFLRLLIFGVGH